MGDPREHTQEYRVRFDECGASGLLRSGGYLRMMQDLAWRHSEVMGFDRQWYRSNRLAWLVRFADLQVTGEARPGDTLQATTRVTGWRHVWARRESHAMVEGTEVASALIDWVLIDEAGRPARIPAGIAGRFTNGIPTFRPARLTLPEPPADAVSRAWSVGIRDLDPMRHVNNATYLDVLDEAVAADTGGLAGHRPPVRYQVEYLRPALPGHTVSVVRWSATDDGTLARCVDGDNQELVRARVTLGLAGGHPTRMRIID